MKIDMKCRAYAIKIIIYFVLCLVTIVFLFPFFFMIMKSFMTQNEAFAQVVQFFPKQLYWKNYSQLFDIQMLNWLKNTLVIVVFNMVVTPISSSFIAFGFAKMRFPFKNVFFTVMMSTVMLPGIVLSIPMYVIYTMLGWTNSALPLIVPCIFGGGALAIFLYVQFMRGISNEIDNAAKIDGAGAFRRYWQICLPLCKAIIIYQVVGIFMGLWNDYTGPLIYINDPEQYTLGLGIYYRYLTGSEAGIDISAGPKMASGVVFSIPPALMFFFFQRQLIEGVNIGSVKG